MKTGTVGPFWALAYHTNSHSPRARKWYRVSRLIAADGAVFELYWHPDVLFRGNSREKIRTDAKVYGIELVPGVWREVAGPSNGKQMERRQ